MNPDTLRVHAPSTIVFLCGGVVDLTLPAATLRDAFYQQIVASPQPYSVVLAEDAKPLTIDAGYADLLTFESDIARVVGLILLFAESAGSLAELGAFSALEAVAPSLLAVLDDFYINQNSFIRHGPVKYLETKYGDEWVFVIERKYVGIADDGTLAALDAIRLTDMVFPAIAKRLAIRPKTEAFDGTNGGHAILLLVGLIREIGALTISEVREYLSYFQVSDTSPNRLHNFLYCAELLGWIKTIHKGNKKYFVATNDETAIDYNFKSDVQPRDRDRLRWRTEIRRYWAATEQARMRAITEASATMTARP